jgi:hypothetical protein
MRRLGLAVAAVLGAVTLLALSAGQALASNVHCGDVLTQDTTLDADLTGCSYPALTIGGPDVSVDLAGHTVDGGIYGDGLRQVSDNVFEGSPRAVVENGTVHRGVHIRNYKNITVQHVGADEIYAERGGVLIQDNVVDGGFLGCDRGGGQVKNNVVRHGDLEFTFGCGPLVTGNLVEQGRINIILASPLLIGNTIRHSPSYGIWLQIGRFTATQNVIVDSALDGVRIRGVEGPTTLRENVILRSGGDGVNAVYDWYLDVPRIDLKDNRIDRNGGDGIEVNSPLAIITGNHAWFNGNLGIEAVPGVSGGANWAKQNGNPAQCVPAFLCGTAGRPRD